jgi:hypothetical protein
MAGVEAGDSAYRVVPDMDSPEVPEYGRQEQSNGLVQPAKGGWSMKLGRSEFMKLFPLALGTPWAVAGPLTAASRVSRCFDPREFGATGDGRHPDTAAVQSAIDAAAGSGGGCVYLHHGTYLCGALRLKSNITLHIEAGAVLLGSTQIEDFPDQPSAYPSRSSEMYTRRSLIFAEKAENVAIEGGGIIDGQGANPAFHHPGMTEGYRPLLLRFSECGKVRVKDITLRNSAMWCQSYLACENVLIDGITVTNRGIENNNDGIDIDDCTNVRIANCNIWCDDDAVCLKSTSSRGCRNVVVENCTLSTLCNAVKMGTDSTGGFENITITNCAVYDTGLAGIALECVDGGTLERVVVSNMVMENVGAAIFLRLGNRGRGMKQPAPGKLRNVIISNVEATGAGPIGSSITGLPGSAVEDVMIENVRITSAGGGTPAEARREVPEVPDAYPELSMFVAPGTIAGEKACFLPAHGLYIRHAAGIILKSLDLRTTQPDARPALVVDDAEGVKIFDLSARSPEHIPAVAWLRDVAGAFVQSCVAGKGVQTFLRVDGAKSAEITLVGNDLSRAVKAIEKGESVRADAVRVSEA